MSQCRKFQFDEKYPIKKGVRRHSLGYAWFRADTKYKSVGIICMGKPRIAVNISELQNAVDEYDVTHVACRSDNIDDIVPALDLLAYIERNPQKVQRSSDGPFALLSVVDVNLISGKKAARPVDDEVVDF